MGPLVVRSFVVRSFVVGSFVVGSFVVECRVVGSLVVEFLLGCVEGGGVGGDEDLLHTGAGVRRST